MSEEEKKEAELPPEFSRLKASKLPLSERADLLDSSNWAHEFNFKEISELAGYFGLFEVTSNTVFLREASAAPYMALIARGTARVLKADDDDIDREIATIGPGKTFGEMSLIDGYPRSASVAAEPGVRLFVLSEANFKRLLSESPELGVKLLLKISKLLSERLRQTSGRLVDFLGT